MGNDSKNKLSLHPIIKWAGGKRQLLDRLPIPEYSNYYEPFLGGGALLFKEQPDSAYVSDLNAQLINMYQVIQSNPEQLITELDSLDSRNAEGKSYYYEIRSSYNECLSINELSIQSAAMFIWLNKHCFNGLYRIGVKNNFNVPYNGCIGKSIDDNLIRKVSQYLKNVNISCQDFELTCATAKSGDFIFLDPPYVPIKASIDSVGGMYDQSGFTYDDNLRLAKLYDRLNSLGIKVLLTNHDVPLIRELYSNYNITTVSVKRNINRDGSNRKGTEVIITNY